MTPEKHDHRLTRWLLAATIALLALVLGLQLWQMFGPKNAPGGVSEPLNPPAASGSPGKTALIEEIQALNPPLAYDDLAALSTEELEQLWEAGAPGLPIGRSLAARLAEEYAGTLAVDSVTAETNPELNETPAHYEVVLHHPVLGDFMYKIAAYSGEVLEGAGIRTTVEKIQVTLPVFVTKELRLTMNYIDAPGNQASAGTQLPKESAALPPAVSGEEAAKAAAFTHAGVSAADAESVRCRPDWEDGYQVYKIEFWVGSTEYDYEIDAATGAVLEAAQETAARPAAGAQQPESFIGEEAAKSAALAHAGLSAADAGYIECELDRDDGLWVYEIEFRAGGVEYDYEIGAADASVLKAQQDR